MDFVVIDVEAANEDLSSICQVGIASFRDGELADAWMSLVDPQSEFSAINIAIHGIDEYKVMGAPTWRNVFPEINARLLDRIVVSHTPFDRAALSCACDRSGVKRPEYRWLDSARVVRRTWSQFSKSGYGLSNVAKHFEIDYQAHDALEDARCAGLLLLRAIAETGLGPEQWLTRSVQPINLAVQLAHHLDGNPDGELFGETLVFTGRLLVPRPEASVAAAKAGCRVEKNVTKRTTMVVVGDQDLQRLNGHEKSKKHREAEQLIGNGHSIRILGESDFMRVVLHSS
jgi:DNA polymerase III subunit epsilon